MFKGKKNTPKASVQQKEAQVHSSSEMYTNTVDDSTTALLASPYYANYESLFHFIIQSGKQPKYKIDLLLESLDMGRNLNAGEGEFYVMESINKNLPYFCESEHEFEKFFNSQKPVLRDSVNGILDMISFYLYSEKHPSKQKYWQQHLLELARNNNFEAQAALCTNFVKNAFSEQEFARFQDIYKSKLIQLAESGNSGAQLAVGEFLMQTPPQKISWLMKAAQHGLSDAWYHLGMTYESMINIDEAGQFKPNRLSSDEIHQLMVKKAECFLNGAKANNGIMAAYCQYRVADYYVEGDLLPKDLNQAAYWCQESLKNGEESAKGFLEYIGKLLSKQ